MAVVQTGTNTYTFYFDNTINNFNNQESQIIFTTTEATKLYYINANDEFILRQPDYGYSGNIYFSVDEYRNYFSISSNGPSYEISKYSNNNIWVAKQGNFTENNIKGFKLENVNLAENQTLETINNLVNSYIGTKTSLSLQFTRTKAAIKIYEDLNPEEYDALTKEPHAFYLVNGVGIYKGTTLISAGANSSMDEIVEELNQAIAAKQDTLVSGTNIKTINGESILGEGNIEVAASDDGVDTAYVEDEVLYIDDDTSAGGEITLDISDIDYLPEEYRNDDMIKKLVLIKDGRVYRFTSFSSDENYTFSWNKQTEVSHINFWYNDWEFYYNEPEELSPKAYVIDEYQRRLDKPSKTYNLLIDGDKFIWNSEDILAPFTMVRINFIDVYDNNNYTYGFIAWHNSDSMTIQHITVGLDFNGSLGYSCVTYINSTNTMHKGTVAGCFAGDIASDQQMTTTYFKRIEISVF